MKTTIKDTETDIEYIYTLPVNASLVCAYEQIVNKNNNTWNYKEFDMYSAEKRIYMFKRFEILED